MIKKLDETVVLKNGRVVTAALFDSVYAEVEKRLALLKPGQTFTLKQLCSPDYWAPMNNREKRQAGWCMKHIESTGQLPVEFIGRKSNRSLLYRKT